MAFLKKALKTFEELADDVDKKVTKDIKKTVKAGVKFAKDVDHTLTEDIDRTLSTGAELAEDLEETVTEKLDDTLDVGAEFAKDMNTTVTEGVDKTLTAGVELADDYVEEIDRIGEHGAHIVIDFDKFLIEDVDNIGVHISHGFKDSKNRVFGKDPETEIKKFSDTRFGRIPYVLEHLKRELIRKNGHQQVGIFRIAADEHRVQEIQKKLGKDKYVQIENCNNSAAFIKIFFRMMPEPIFDDGMKRIVKSMDEKTIQDGKTCFEWVKLKVRKYFQVLLEWLLDLCSIIERLKEKNKMSSSNLSIVISPNLYRVKSPMDFLQISSRMSQFFTTLLEYRIRNR